MFKKNVAILILLLCCLPICGFEGCESGSAIEYRVESNIISHIRDIYSKNEETKTDDSTLDQKFLEESERFRKIEESKLMSQLTDDAILEIIANSQAANTYKNMAGYSNICGIMTSNNGIVVNGNVIIYGGVYTSDVLTLKNGAFIIADNNYIDKIASYNKIYNGDLFIKRDKLECFLTEGINGSEKNSSEVIYNKHYKPVDIRPIKRKIKLVNISEGEEHKDKN